MSKSQDYFDQLQAQIDGLSSQFKNGASFQGPVLFQKATTLNDFVPKLVGSNTSAGLTGTLTITNGATSVTGTGTKFTTELTTNSYIRLTADLNSALARVANIVSDTSLTLATAYAGTGGTGKATSSTPTVMVTKTLELRVGNVLNQATGFTVTTQASAVLADAGSLISVDSGQVILSRNNIAMSAPGDYFDIPLDLPDGAMLRSATISTRGLLATSPTLPSYQLFSTDGGTPSTSLSSGTPDVHTTGGGNWLSTTLDTTINVSAAPTVIPPSVPVNRGLYTYFLRVTNPYEGVTGSQVIVQRLKATWVPTQVMV